MRHRIRVGLIRTVSLHHASRSTAQLVGRTSKWFVVRAHLGTDADHKEAEGHDLYAGAGPEPAAVERRSRNSVSSAWALPRALGGRGRRRRIPIVIAGSLISGGVLAFILAGRRDDFATALSSAALPILGLSVALQVAALLARSEAWHLSIQAAGGTIERRVLYRASSMGILGSVLNGQLGVAARIAALRHSSPGACPQVPTLIAAEFPILAVEGTLAALTSFTLVGPLGLPWWLPLIVVAVVATASAGLRHLGLRKGRQLWRGLLVLRRLSHGSRLIGFVLVAIFAQILRNWMLLHAVGVDASLFDSIAVLIAVVTLSQLPIGPSVGAAAAVLILGQEGVAATAAAGLLMTATGTAGGFCFLAWAGADRLWFDRRRASPA